MSDAFDLSLTAGAHRDDELAVLSFRADEALSTPFELEVVVHPARDVVVDVDALLGAPATLSVREGDDFTRRFNGIVSRVRLWRESAAETGRRATLTVVPRLWLLSRRSRCRIFQQQSVPDIVKEVLAAHEVDVTLKLSSTYAPRTYCVQYNETDLAFVSRLLEDEGIFYFFEHDEERHELILGDDPSVHPQIAGEARVVFRPDVGMTRDVEAFETFGVTWETRPGKVVLRDFDPDRPGLDLTAKSEASEGDPRLEVYDYPGKYADLGDGERLARIRLEEARLRACIYAGSSTCRRLIPGHRFELDEHPLAELNRKLLVVSAQHHGAQPAILESAPATSPATSSSPSSSTPPQRYRNEVACVPEGTPARPGRRTPRPFIAGPQTAIVVGPKGEEIHCDPQGRVKVQFHWDRLGERDDRSSCWLRVGQAWAGPGFGALYLPRVGHEVIVEFLEGDPDRPLITGSVYNGANPPPIGLPQDKTQSTLRSASSPGGGGSNELRFEDAAGAEQVYLHAQKDLAVSVGNDRSTSVGGNETLEVGKDRSRAVGGQHVASVGGDDQTSIDGNQTLSVKGDRSTSVRGSHTETIQGDQSIKVGGARSLMVGLAMTETIGGGRSTTVLGASALTVGGLASETIAGARSEQVGGARSEVIAGKRSEVVGGARTLSVGGDLSETTGGERKLKVGGDLSISAGGKLTQTAGGDYELKAASIVLEGKDEIALKAGSATIVLKANGDVAIKGAKVSLKASGDLKLKGSTIAEN